MTKLLIATAAFLASHYASSTALRARLINALGNNGYLVLYSAAAVATLVPMIWTYYRAPFIGLWHVPALRYVPLMVMPVSLALIACSLTTPSPTLIGGERLLKDEEPARGILRVTRHPMMWASRCGRQATSSRAAMRLHLFSSAAFSCLRSPARR